MRAPPVIERVSQWGHGTNRRAAFLLLALGVPLNIDAPVGGVTYSAYVPTITTSASQHIPRIRRPTFFDPPQLWSHRYGIATARTLALVPTAANTPEALAYPRTEIVENVRMLRGRISSAVRHTFLGAQGDPTNIQVPGASIAYTAFAPSIDVVDMVPCALGDDGNWPEVPPFIQQRKFSGFALDYTPLSVSPPAATIAYSAFVPTVTVSNNALVYPPNAEIIYTPIAPEVTVFGNPDIAVPVAHITYTAHAPIVVGIVDIKFGGDDAPRHITHVVHERTNPNLRRAKLRLKKDADLDREIREIYQALHDDPKTADLVEKIIAPVVAPLEVVESTAPLSVAVPRRTPEQNVETLRAKADAEQPDAVQAEIALRMLYELRRREELDDEQAIIKLLEQLI